MMMGVAASTAGHSAAMASASAAHSVGMPPRPVRTPLPFWLPGWTTSTLVPRPWNWSCTSWPADWHDRDQEDHRRHADDDAQHGEARPHLVLRQRPQGDAKDHQGVHGIKDKDDGSKDETAIKR